MDTNLHEVHKQYAFDSFCKRVLKNEAYDFFREVKRQLARETSLTELETHLEEQLYENDEYPLESHSFNVLGYDILIRSDLLAESLAALPERKRVILLLYHFFDMTDKEIGELLGMVRQTVQYQRTRTLQRLCKMMEEFENE